jgi:hypothetical protein
VRARAADRDARGRPRAPSGCRSAAALEALPSVYHAVSRTGTSGGFHRQDARRLDSSGLVGLNARVDVVEAVAGTAPPFDASTARWASPASRSARPRSSAPGQLSACASAPAAPTTYLNGVFRRADARYLIISFPNDASLRTSRPRSKSRLARCSSRRRAPSTAPQASLHVLGPLLCPVAARGDRCCALGRRRARLPRLAAHGSWSTTRAA